MLPLQRNKATLSILDKLKQKGMPAAATSPVDGFDEEAQPAVEDQDLGAMGQVLRAPGPSAPIGLGKPKKKKPLLAPSEDEGVYE